MSLSLKHFFTILILFILILFVLNVFFPKNIEVDEIQKTPESKRKKTVGINIERKNLNGENIKISAEELNENTENKYIKLKNSITTIKRNGIDTKIEAGSALIKNNYDEFKLTNKVKVVNLHRNFVLKTEKLNGQFKNGSMYTLNDIDLRIKNAKIEGKGLKLLNHGEYIKIFGKAKLILKNNEK